MNGQKLLCSRAVLFTSTRSRSKFWNYVLGRKAKQPKEDKSKRYADTLCLPKTKFPLSVKDGLAAKRELEIQKTAGFEQLYAWQASQPREKVFSLHDGPPYANGKTHVGHAVNKILKDITTRYKLLRGYRVHYVPGWDCHGMPIEIKALSQARTKGQSTHLSSVQIRDQAKKFAAEALKDQMASFRRWGVMADWSSYYTTLSPDYEAAQLDVFYNIYEKGLIYRDYMPVFWSPSSRTALAEAELEYNPEHRSTAVYVRLPLTRLTERLLDIVGEDGAVSAVIWTTTPWTLPFNKAVCYSDAITYACLKEANSSDVYLCEEEFTEALSDILGRKLKLIGKLEGADLKGAKYAHPISRAELPFLPGQHVTARMGTGLVHTAPAHGHDDFQIALQHDLSVNCGVDEVGRYMDGAVDEKLRGRQVGKDADEAVIDLLGAHVLRKGEFVHSYPYDWRTKKPVIIRASKQWFVNTQQLKEKALECLQDVKIIPRQSEHGMTQQLQKRPYWCISRQRVWGLPIPVFYHRTTGDPLITRETVDHLKEVLRQEGTDAWWTLTVSDLLPAQLLSQLDKGVPEDYIKGRDIMDIWFDSGVSWASVLKDVGGQADMYLEGIDQFGGWFQTSLLTSVAVQGHAPYRSLMVHGFATDESGKKMSKSLGNVVDPDTVVNGGKDKKKDPAYGVEVLRWWVGHSHAHTNIMIGPNILQQFSESLFKVRKSMRYLLGNLYDLDPDRDLLPYNSLLPQDQYMLHLLHEFAQQVEGFYEEYSYGKVLQALERFVNTSLSSFYINMTRDRCYCSDHDSEERRSCQTTQYHVVRVLSVAAAPILPHLMEEVHAHLPDNAKHTDVLFKGGWLEVEEEWHNPELKHRIMPVFSIRDSIVDALASASPSEFEVLIYASPLLDKYLKELQKDNISYVSPLCELMGTSHVTVLTVPPDVIPDDDCMFVSGSVDIHKKEKDKVVTVNNDYKLMIMVSDAQLCERCRRYVSNSSTSPCDRCLHVLGGSWAS
ncbi:isoleucine--tRNA ligase, mitochondrial-like [Littorina saxatilis]|uniref:isoleucine--tRNA ligase n=1 Tax=Littorina saxatilis TaxID=31220 RepID=A0AAN9BGE4_9CAEN